MSASAPVSAPDARLSVRKTYKLYIGGAFPRSESGRSYEVTSADGTFLANAALASRKDARDAVVKARGAFSGWSGATAYNRGQILYRVAEMLEGRREQFVAEVRAVEGLTEAEAAAQVDAGDRPLGLVRGLDRQDRRRSGRALTRSPGRSGTSRRRSRPVWSRSSPRSVPRCSAWSRCSRPRSPSATRPCVVAPDSAAAARGDPGRGAGHLRPARRRRQHPDGPDRRAGASRWRTTSTWTPSTWPASPTRSWPRRWSRRVRRTSSGCCVRPPPPRDWTAQPGAARLTAFLETKTVWHPVGA